MALSIIQFFSYLPWWDNVKLNVSLGDFKYHNTDTEITLWSLMLLSLFHVNHSCCTLILPNWHLLAVS